MNPNLETESETKNIKDRELQNCLILKTNLVGDAKYLGCIVETEKRERLRTEYGAVRIFVNEGERVRAKEVASRARDGTRDREHTVLAWPTSWRHAHVSLGVVNMLVYVVSSRRQERR